MQEKEKYHLAISGGSGYESGLTGVNDMSAEEIDDHERLRRKNGKTGLLKYHHLPRVERLIVWFEQNLGVRWIWLNYVLGKINNFKEASVLSSTPYCPLA